MNNQLITLFGILCLILSTIAQDNSTKTASLASNEDVKPALNEAQAANQKVDNQELDRTDVKEKIDGIVDGVADKFNDAKQAGSDAVDTIKAKAANAADSVKDMAETAADKLKDTAEAAKEKLENSVGMPSTSAWSALAAALILFQLARLF